LEVEGGEEAVERGEVEAGLFGAGGGEIGIKIRIMIMSGLGRELRSLGGDGVVGGVGDVVAGWGGGEVLGEVEEHL
jgi:hypothetical protein